MRWYIQHSDRAFGHSEDDPINHCSKCERFRWLCLRIIWHLILIIDLIYCRTQTNLINIHNQAETSQLHIYHKTCDTSEENVMQLFRINNWTHRRGGEGWGPAQGQQSHQHSINRTSLNLLVASSDRLCKFVSQKPTVSGRENPGTGLWNTHRYLAVAHNCLQKAQAEFTWVCNRFTNL